VGSRWLHTVRLQGRPSTKAVVIHPKLRAFIGLNVEPPARLRLDQLNQLKAGQESSLPQGAPKPEKFLAVLEAAYAPRCNPARSLEVSVKLAQFHPQVRSGAAPDCWVRFDWVLTNLMHLSVRHSEYSMSDQHGGTLRMCTSCCVYLCVPVKAP
jgi:hypothetical protein